MKKVFTLLTLALLSIGSVWATDFTYDISTVFGGFNDAQKNAVISNGIVSGDNLISISFSNPGTDFQREGTTIKMRGASERNATITINGGIIATISQVVLTYSGTKRNFVSNPSVTRTDDDTNKTMTWSFDNVSSLTLSQNVGNTNLTKIEVTYSATDITATTAVWDFQNGNPASLATEAIGIEGKEVDVTSSVSGIKMHVNAKSGAAYDGIQGKLNYRSANGDAQCNRGTVIQIPVKGTLDVVTLLPNSGGYTIAGGSEVTAKTTYTATAADVAQGYVEIVCSTSGYLYGLRVAQYSASKSIGATGWSTFSCSQPLDFSDVAGLDAYMITGFSGSAVTSQAVNGTIPAETGLLLKGTAGETYSIPVAASSSTVTTSNKLVACLTATAVSAGVDPMVNYVLMNDGADNAVFQWIGTTDANVGAGKAYLALSGGPKGAGARLSIDFEDDVTAISSTRNSKFVEQNEFFDLQGRRVAQPTKGLYIVNGRKVVIK